MNQKLKILHLEDLPADAELVERELKKAGIEFDKRVVDNKQDFEKALDNFLPDIILSDHSLPSFDSTGALKILKEKKVNIPFILITATVSEEFAVEVMKHGAIDYILKDRLQRLPNAVLSAIEKNRIELQRQKTMEQLFASEIRYRRLFEAAKDGILILNADTGVIEDVNPFLMEMLGYSHTEFLGKQLWEIGLFKDIIANKSAFIELIKERYIRYENLPLQTKDGRTIWVEFVSNAYDVGGKQVIQCNIRDITERKKAEEKLVKSEELFSGAFHSSPAGIIITRIADGKIIDANESFHKIFEFSRDETIGHTSVELNMLAPGERAKLIQRQLESGGIVNFELLSQSKSGKPLNLLLSSKQLTINDELCHITTLIDISERKKLEQKTIQSQERYKDLVENITDLICTHDLNGRILSVNKAAEKIIGFRFDSEKNWNIKDILSPDKKHAFDEYITAIKETGHAEGLMKVQTSAGEIRIWEYQNTLRTIGIKTPIVRGYARDITERKKAEREIMEMNQQLRDLSAHLQNIREEERTHIAREVHDVLGQQITGLKMDISWLNKKIKTQDGEMKERFENIFTLADETVKSIRKISTELRPGILDDLGLIPALEWQSNEFEKRTGVKCRFITELHQMDIPKPTATGIFRIFQETLTNVARHANAKRVDSSMTFKDNVIKLIIADNGKGFNSEEMKLKKTLGIVGMKERAAMMNGTLTMQSPQEGGTVVTLSVEVNKQSPS